jgi:hypothetical protein
MDVADRSDLQNEMYLKAQLQVRKPEGPKAGTRCNNCNEPGMAPNQKFCDSDCEKDFSYREKMRRIGR